MPCSPRTARDALKRSRSRCIDGGPSQAKDIPITEAELRLIASVAIIDDGNQPVSG